MDRQNHDRRHDLHPVRHGGDFHGELQRGRHQQDIDDVMFGYRNGIESEPVGEGCLFEHVSVELVAAIGLVRIVCGQLNTEFHEILSRNPQFHQIPCRLFPDVTNRCAISLHADVSQRISSRPPVVPFISVFPPRTRIAQFRDLRHLHPPSCPYDHPRGHRNFSLPNEAQPGRIGDDLQKKSALRSDTPSISAFKPAWHLRMLRIDRFIWRSGLHIPVFMQPGQSVAVGKSH